MKMSHTDISKALIGRIYKAGEHVRYLKLMVGNFIAHRQELCRKYLSLVCVAELDFLHHMLILL